MGASAGEAAPHGSHHSRGCRRQHQRQRTSLLADDFRGAAPVGRCRRTKPDSHAVFRRRAARAATGTIPIVWTGVEPVRFGLVTSLARPGGNITGVTVDAGSEIWGKRLQIIKETVPSASKVVYLGMRADWEARITELSEAGRQLEVSVIGVPLQESTPYQRVFAKIAQEPPGAIIVSDISELLAHGQSIVEFVEKSRVPTMYSHRHYVELGGLMAYASDPTELGRRVADDVHQILNGATPSDIPIYQPTKFEFVINLKTANALGLTIPPAILARADEVIE